MHESVPYTRVERRLLEGIAEQLWAEAEGRLKPIEFWRVLRQEAIGRGFLPPSPGQTKRLIWKFKMRERREGYGSAARHPALYLDLAEIWIQLQAKAGKAQQPQRPWPSSPAPADPHPPADLGASSPPRACEECVREETCRRLRTCVLHNRVFGDVDRP